MKNKSIKNKEGKTMGISELLAADKLRKEDIAAEKRAKAEAKIAEASEMTGSPKQIEWAEAIRIDFTQCREWRDRVMENQEIGNRGYYEFLLAGMVVSKIERITDAEWWIEHRNVLSLPSFKSAFRRISREMIPEWAIKQCLIDSGYVPMRGPEKVIFDKEFQAGAPDTFYAIAPLAKQGQ